MGSEQLCLGCHHVVIYLFNGRNRTNRRKPLCPSDCTALCVSLAKISDINFGATISLAEILMALLDGCLINLVRVVLGFLNPLSLRALKLILSSRLIILHFFYLGLPLNKIFFAKKLPFLLKNYF